LKYSRFRETRLETGSDLHCVTDVGSLTPHLGGETFRYDTLPGMLILQRRRLRFVYFDGKGLRALSFADARNFDNSGFENGD
jgi:hypothetical protein